MATAVKKPEEKEGSKSKKKGGKIKILIIALLVLMVAGGGGFAAFTILSPKPHHKAAFVPPIVGPLVSFPSITTNLSDGHLIQITMSFQLIVGALPADVSALQQKMTNTAIIDLSAWTYSQLLAPAAKDQLKAQLMTSFNAIVKQATGKNEISNIFITNFLMQ